MPVTMRNIRVGDILKIMKKKYKLTPNHRVDIIFDVKQIETNESQEADIDNLGDFLIQGFEEILAHKKGDVEFPPSL